LVLSKAQAGHRYISLAPSTTEILFALGLDEEIAGVSSYCDYPELARSKEKIGSFSQPDIEKILSLKPDIVFSTGLEQQAVVEELKKLGLKVMVSDPQNFSELYDSISEIGKLTAKENAARELISKMKKDIGEVVSQSRAIATGKRKKVFVEIWHDPLMTAGKNTFVNELITFAGGINIAEDAAKPYSFFSAEDVI